MDTVPAFRPEQIGGASAKARAVHEGYSPTAFLPLFQSLTLKHQRFVGQYVTDLNATKAYMQVFPETDAPTAGVNGHKLLKNAKIFSAVMEVQANLLGHLESRPRGYFAKSAAVAL